MIEAIKEVLKGIDQTELESTDGWWETSAGAEFGAKKLKYILGLLAQPAQLEERNFCSRCGKRTADLTVIHTCTPPQRKPLTDDEIWDTYMKAPVDINCHISDLHKFARAIEAAHNIKENT